MMRPIRTFNSAGKIRFPATETGVAETWFDWGLLRLIEKEVSC
jgi:hypothetical protein